MKGFPTLFIREELVSGLAFALYTFENAGCEFYKREEEDCLEEEEHDFREGDCPGRFGAFFLVGIVDENEGKYCQHEKEIDDVEDNDVDLEGGHFEVGDNVEVGEGSDDVWG